METRERSQTPYEVYCRQCRVSFPIGTRKCLHCGGRIGRPGASQPLAIAPHPLERMPEDELPKRGGRMSPFTVMWIVLALGVAVQRACAS